MWNEAQRSINDLMTIEQPPEPPKPEKVRIMFINYVLYNYLLSLTLFIVDTKQDGWC